MTTPTQEKLRRAHGEIPTFGLNDITRIDGKYRLRIHLAETDFFLPLVHLNFPGVEEAAIGWFDPNPEKNPQIDEAATIAMGMMLKKMKPTVAVMTNSTKSEHFISQAVGQFSPTTHLIVLPSGSEEICRQNIIDRSVGTPTRYTPVTGTPKIMGYPSPQDGQLDYMSLTQLQTICPNGKGLVILDDVYTTGSTTKAMESVLGLQKHGKHHVIVVAVERQYDGSTHLYRGTDLPKNIHAAFYLSEFTGLDSIGINRSELHTYDKPSIPPAIVR